MKCIIRSRRAAERRSDNHAVKKSVFAVLDKESHSGGMVYGNISDPDIFAVIENHSRAEPQFMFDNECISFAPGEAVFHTDEPIAAKDILIGNGDAS